MYENGKMKHVETIPEMEGEEGKKTEVLEGNLQFLDKQNTL
jgi:hypothetical protein